MKNNFKIAIITFVLFVSSTGLSLADGPGGPGAGSSGTGAPTGAPPIGGSAPIDGGLAILLILATLYISEKIYCKMKLNKH
jgi:hypothetical protein